LLPLFISINYSSQCILFCELQFNFQQGNKKEIIYLGTGIRKLTWYQSFHFEREAKFQATQQFTVADLLDLEASSLQQWVFKGPTTDPQLFATDLSYLQGDLNRSINQK
jgi:hypothetical protein